MLYPVSTMTISPSWYCFCIFKEFKPHNCCEGQQLQKSVFLQWTFVVTNQVVWLLDKYFKICSWDKIEKVVLILIDKANFFLEDVLTEKLVELILYKWFSRSQSHMKNVFCIKQHTSSGNCTNDSKMKSSLFLACNTISFTLILKYDLL